MSNGTTLTTDELDHRLHQRGAFIFWNVLTEEYFGGELIPGSLWVPVDTVGREAKRLGLSPDAEIVVYCANPTCPNSTDAAKKLRTLGFTNVRAYEGGLEEWKASGRQVGRLPARAAA
jgi:rhodanese-related sulfurtransferase